MGVDSQYVEVAAEVFSLLSDPTRIRIVLALRDEELSVNHLADIVDKSPTAVSQHLSKLRWGRMVTTRQEGNRVFYRLTDEHARNLVAEAVSQAEHALEPRTAHERAGVAPGASAHTHTHSTHRTEDRASNGKCPAR
ncbi:ArsR/SmtB family transcription factor [Kineococcus rubinsiae]|uniref:ArsR/SmtB family transcription factor n=1 Tax=Kineococcus rubinsiae TaxID=2609562 RepID=UPI001AD8FED0|nr:metalloregulator ArsR/SmtB family transcription factor [Kineococcus rubinsiae]